MAYKCPKCENTAEEAGNCSACNVAMVEATATAETPTATETPAA